MSSIFGTVWKSPKVTKLLIVQQFFEGFVPIMALYAIMFGRVGGLNLEQIGLLFALWGVAYVAAELPSGVLADYWSRKHVMVIGGLLRAAGFAVWMIWPNFTGYAVGFALWGAQIACSSGALAAYLHNELRAQDREQAYARYFGWVMSALSAGTLAGFFVAAVLTLDHTNVLIGMSVVSSLLLAFILILMKERPYKRQETYLKTLRTGLAEITRSKKLRYMCYGLFAVFMVIGVLEELLPRVYADFGLSDSHVSLILAAALLAGILLLTRLEIFVRFSLAKQMLVMCFVLATLAAGLIWGGWGGVSLILVFSLIFHLFRPVFMHHVQVTAKGDQRATIGSIPGLAAGLLGALAYIIIGAVAAATSERFSIGLYGVFWLFAMAGLTFMGRKYARPAGKPEVATPLKEGPN